MLCYTILLAKCALAQPLAERLYNYTTVINRKGRTRVHMFKGWKGKDQGVVPRLRQGTLPPPQNRTVTMVSNAKVLVFSHYVFFYKTTYPH